MKGYRLFLKKFLEDKPATLGLLIILGLIVTAILAPYIAPYPNDVFDNHPAERLQPPSWQHPFGTDSLGRDIFSRILFGGRITLLISVTVVGLSILIGVPTGLIAGYYENVLSEVIMRVADIFLAIPRVILAMAMAQALGPSLPNVMLALSVTYWPWFTRIVVAETKALKKTIFIEATEALGASDFRTIVFHILPNIASPIIVRSTIGMGFTILTAAVLGFLGLGAQPPTPEWGAAIADSRLFLPDAWWYATFPGLAIFLVVMGFNMLGDGLRDVIDPRLRRSR
ncbi:MAG: ABC transporter permease [Nitrospinota bacterium]|nr:MAG: ABC transporter permease [Nitrospinota bacterium]